VQYRIYGKTGDKLSVFGFGAMRLPMKDDHVDMDLSVAIIRKSFDLGVNYVDTAVGYCNSESQIAVGKAVKGYRDKVFVSTKNPYKNESGDEWQELLDQSLERLDVDYIDYYHSHDVGWEGYNRMLGPGKPMERFRKAKEQGLIRHMCFSCHDSPENMIKLIDTGEFAGMLVQYNLLDRRNEEAIAHAHEKGMGVAIMGPIGGGRLVSPSEKLQSMVEGGVKSTPEIALRFVISNPNVTIALSGMNSMDMVLENCATADDKEPLSDEERKRVIEILTESAELAKLYCTGCGYCMPCKNDIDIPANFNAMNLYRVFGLKQLAKSNYKGLGKRRKRDGTVVEAWASACIECGECEPKCPQEIAIRDQLKETHATLGDN
jgi:predicted aldo/keto reductase-like oxidoreductase